MSKTVYSLVLSSEVVAAIDELAAREGCNRSALINRVLAQHASLSTPEQRSHAMLLAVQQQAGQRGLRPSFSPGGALQLHTTLRYKYNPRLCYTLTLSEHPAQLGQLQVTLRSQNQQLLAHMQAFYRLWQQLEGAQPAFFAGPAQTQPPTRYTRTLRRPAGEAAGGQLAALMAAYVQRMNRCLQAFCADVDQNPQLAERQATQQYHSGQNDGSFAL